MNRLAQQRAIAKFAPHMLRQLTSIDMLLEQCIKGAKTRDARPFELEPLSAVVLRSSSRAAVFMFRNRLRFRSFGAAWDRFRDRLFPKCRRIKIVKTVAQADQYAAEHFKQRALRCLDGLHSVHDRVAVYHITLLETDRPLRYNGKGYCYWTLYDAHAARSALRAWSSYRADQSSPGEGDPAASLPAPSPYPAPLQLPTAAFGAFISGATSTVLAVSNCTPPPGVERIQAAFRGLSLRRSLFGYFGRWRQPRPVHKDTRVGSGDGVRFTLSGPTPPVDSSSCLAAFGDLQHVQEHPAAVARVLCASYLRTSAAGSRVASTLYRSLPFGKPDPDVNPASLDRHLRALLRTPHRHVSSVAGINDLRYLSYIWLTRLHVYVSIDGELPWECEVFGPCYAPVGHILLQIRHCRAKFNIRCNRGGIFTWSPLTRVTPLRPPAGVPAPFRLLPSDQAGVRWLQAVEPPNMKDGMRWIVSQLGGELTIPNLPAVLQAVLFCFARVILQREMTHLAAQLATSIISERGGMSAAVCCICDYDMLFEFLSRHLEYAQMPRDILRDVGDGEADTVEYAFRAMTDWGKEGGFYELFRAENEHWAIYVAQFLLLVDITEQAVWGAPAAPARSTAEVMGGDWTNPRTLALARCSKVIQKRSPSPLSHSSTPSNADTVHPVADSLLNLIGAERLEWSDELCGQVTDHLLGRGIDAAAAILRLPTAVLHFTIDSAAAVLGNGGLLPPPPEPDTSGSPSESPPPRPNNNGGQHALAAQPVATNLDRQALFHIFTPKVQQRVADSELAAWIVDKLLALTPTDHLRFLTSDDLLQAKIGELQAPPQNTCVASSSCSPPPAPTGSPADDLSSCGDLAGVSQAEPGPPPPATAGTPAPVSSPTAPAPPDLTSASFPALSSLATAAAAPSDPTLVTPGNQTNIDISLQRALPAQFGGGASPTFMKREEQPSAQGASTSYPPHLGGPGGGSLPDGPSRADTAGSNSSHATTPLAPFAATIRTRVANEIFELGLQEHLAGGDLCSASVQIADWLDTLTLAPSEADSQYFFAANLNLGQSNEQAFALAVEPLARALVRVHRLCLPIGAAPGSSRGAADQLNRPHNLGRFTATAADVQRARFEPLAASGGTRADPHGPRTEASAQQIAEEQHRDGALEAARREAAEASREAARANRVRTWAAASAIGRQARAFLLRRLCASLAHRVRVVLAALSILRAWRSSLLRRRLQNMIRIRTATRRVARSLAAATTIQRQVRSFISRRRRVAAAWEAALLAKVESLKQNGTYTPFVGPLESPAASLNSLSLIDQRSRQRRLQRELRGDFVPCAPTPLQTHSARMLGGLARRFLLRRRLAALPSARILGLLARRFLFRRRCASLAHHVRVEQYGHRLQHGESLAKGVLSIPDIGELIREHCKRQRVEWSGGRLGRLRLVQDDICLAAGSAVCHDLRAVWQHRAVARLHASAAFVQRQWRLCRFRRLKVFVVIYHSETPNTAEGDTTKDFTNPAVDPPYATQLGPLCAQEFNYYTATVQDVFTMLIERLGIGDSSRDCLTHLEPEHNIPGQHYNGDSDSRYVHNSLTLFETQQFRPLTCRRRNLTSYLNYHSDGAHGYCRFPMYSTATFQHSRFGLRTETIRFTIRRITFRSPRAPLSLAPRSLPRGRDHTLTYLPGVGWAQSCLVAPADRPQRVPTWLGGAVAPPKGKPFDLVSIWRAPSGALVMPRQDGAQPWPRRALDSPPPPRLRREASGHTERVRLHLGCALERKESWIQTQKAATVIQCRWRALRIAFMPGSSANPLILPLGLINPDDTDILAYRSACARYADALHIHLRSDDEWSFRYAARLLIPLHRDWRGCRVESAFLDNSICPPLALARLSHGYFTSTKFQHDLAVPLPEDAPHEFEYSSRRGRSFASPILISGIISSAGQFVDSVSSSLGSLGDELGGDEPHHLPTWHYSMPRALNPVTPAVSLRAARFAFDYFGSGVANLSAWLALGLDLDRLDKCARVIQHRWQRTYAGSISRGHSLNRNLEDVDIYVFPEQMRDQVVNRWVYCDGAGIVRSEFVCHLPKTVWNGFLRYQQGFNYLRSYGSEVYEYHQAVQCLLPSGYSLITIQGVTVLPTTSIYNLCGGADLATVQRAGGLVLFTRANTPLQAHLHLNCGFPSRRPAMSATLIKLHWRSHRLRRVFRLQVLRRVFRLWRRLKSARKSTAHPPGPSDDDDDSKGDDCSGGDGSGGAGDGGGHDRGSRSNGDGNQSDGGAGGSSSHVQAIDTDHMSTESSVDGQVLLASHPRGGVGAEMDFTMDLASGFHTLPIKEEDMKLTAFRTHAEMDFQIPADALAFDAECFRAAPSRRRNFSTSPTARSLAVFKLVVYIFRSRRFAIVPFAYHQRLLPPFRGHNSQSHYVMRHLLSTYRLGTRHLPSVPRPLPPFGFYRPVPSKVCGYGSGDLASDRDFTRQTTIAKQVIQWYDRAGCTILLAAFGGSTPLCSNYGFSNCNSFGSLLPATGVDVQLVDLEIHPAARDFYGDENCHVGDALDYDLRIRLTTRPGCVGNHESPNCQAVGTIGRLSAAPSAIPSVEERPHSQAGSTRVPQQLVATRAVQLSLWQQTLVPYSIETIGAGSRFVKLPRARRLRGVDFGARTADPHHIETTPGYRLHVDSVLSTGGTHLLSRSCSGGQNSLPGRDRFGAPFKKPCCNGNITSFHGTTAVCSLSKGAQRLGLDSRLAPSWSHLVNATPPLMGMFVHTQLCCLIADRQLNIPFISYDSILRDPRLARFSEGKHLKNYAAVSTVRSLRPLWPRFERATLTVLLSPGSTGCKDHTIMLSEAGPGVSGAAGLEPGWLHAKFFLPIVDIDNVDGSPIYELFCAQMEKNWGIEAWGIRPRIAACEPGVIHFATNVPPSDDVVDYVAKRGFSTADDFELFKQPQDSRRLHPLGAPDARGLKLLSSSSLIHLYEEYSWKAEDHASIAPPASAVINPLDLNIISMVVSRIPIWAADQAQLDLGSAGNASPPATEFHLSAAGPLSPFAAITTIGCLVEDPADWLSYPLQTADLPFVRGDDRRQWQVVCKLGKSGPIPWVLAGPSHLLDSLGIAEQGLYSLRSFRGAGKRGVTYSEGDVIGTYTGIIVAGPFADPLTDAAKSAGFCLASSGRQHLLWSKRVGGWFIIDGKNSSLPSLSLMNDGRGSVQNNVRFTSTAKARATRRVPPANLKGATCLADLAASELLADYGGDFWKLHGWVEHVCPPTPPIVNIATLPTPSAPIGASITPLKLTPPYAGTECPIASDLNTIVMLSASAPIAASPPGRILPHRLGPAAPSWAAARIQRYFRRLSLHRCPQCNCDDLALALVPCSASVSRPVVQLPRRGSTFRASNGWLYHVDEDGVSREVGEIICDDRPGAVGPLLRLSHDSSAHPNKRRAAAVLAAASGASEGVAIFNHDNDYWIESVIRKMASMSSLPAASVFSAQPVDESTEPPPPPSGADPKVTYETPKVVDCLDGLHGPMLFTDLEFRNTEDPESVMSTPATYALRATVCPDTGGALSLLGALHADRLREDFPDSIEVADYNTYVHRTHDERVQGIGGVCLIIARVHIRFYVAGRRFYVKNVAVVQGFEGIILGNDFHHGAGSIMDYAKEELRFDHPSGQFSTPFTTVRRPVRQPQNASNESSNAVIDTVIPTSVLLSEPLAPAMRKLAYAPRHIKVPAQCLDHLIYVQVPSSIPVGSQVLLDRLPPDCRPHQHLNIVIAASVARVLPNRLVALHVINPNKFPVSLPELTALATFEMWEGNEHAPEFNGTQVFNAVNLGPDIKGNAVRERLVQKLLDKHCSSFRSTPGYTHAVKHSIDTPTLAPPYGAGTLPPPRARIKPENNEQRAALRAEIDKRLKAQLISPSRSPFCSRPMLVRKSDGTFRCVIDVRALNQVTTKDHYPLPNLTDNLSKCNGSWFTVLDLLSGFDQVELEEGSKAKTAFGTSFGLFQYERMTMGLTGAPATFQRLVDAVLSGLPSSLCLSYIDDIIIKTDSEDFEDHMNDVDCVLTRLFEAGLSIKAKKMFIGFRKVTYLGYEVSKEGIRPDPERTTAILDMPEQKIMENVKTAGSFLGMAGFYRNFIPHFSEVASPFYELTGKGANVRSVLGSLRMRCSILLLKQCLSSSALMRRPDPSKPFFIAVDAATMHGCGGVLYQIDEDGTEGIVACFSHRFSEEERGWNTHEAEAYGLYLAVTKYFDTYIGDASFTVYVDHAALQWLMSSNRELHNKKVRDWIEKLQLYDMQVIHRPGRDHVAPDALSRILYNHAPQLWLNKPGTFDTWPGLSAPSPFSFAAGSPFSLPGGSRGGSSKISRLSARAGITPPRYKPVVEDASTLPPLPPFLPRPQPPRQQSRLSISNARRRRLERESRANSFLIHRLRHLLHRRRRPLVLRATPPAPAGIPPDPTDFLERQFYQPDPRKHMKAISRVCLVLARGMSILGLALGDAVALPGGRLNQRFKQRPRDAATACFKALFGSPTPLLEALICSSGRRYTCGSTRYFIVKVPDNFPPLLNELPTILPLSSFTATDIAATFIDVSSSDTYPFADPDDTFFVGRAQTVARGGNGPEQLRVFRPPVPLSGPADTQPTNPSALVVAPSPDGLLSQPVQCCSDPESYGPAYHDNPTSAWAALRMIDVSLTSPGSPRLIALDTEGKLTLFGGFVELIQLCVAAGPGDDRDHIHVFDIRRDPSPLADPTSPLRRWIADPDIVKIAHCCRGDASAIFGRFRILPAGWFDTSVADALVSDRHPFAPRSLGTVISAHLPEVVLDHKGTVVHEHDTWTRRPLTQKLFEYAYQDVSFCISLYLVLCQKLEERCFSDLPLAAGGNTISSTARHFIDLSFMLTTVSIPPYTLEDNWAEHVSPSRAVVILHDHRDFLCLTSPTGAVQLPEFPLALHTVQHRLPKARPFRCFRQSWTDYFGPPTKTGGLRNSLGTRVRKPLCLPNFYLIEVVCDAPVSVAIEGMEPSLPLGTVLRSFTLSSSPLTAPLSSITSQFGREHACALLYMLHLANHTPRYRDVLAQSVTDATTALLTAGEDLHKAPPGQGGPPVQDEMALPGEHGADVHKADPGPQNARYHLLLRDDTHFLVLVHQQKGTASHILPWSRPTAQSLTSRACAFHGLEVMLGPIVRYSQRFGHYARACALNGRFLSADGIDSVYECRVDPEFSLMDYASDLFVAFHNRRHLQWLVAVADWKLVRLDAGASILPRPLASALAVSLDDRSPPVPTNPISATYGCLLILTSSTRGPEFIVSSDRAVRTDGFTTRFGPSGPSAAALLRAVPVGLRSCAAVVGAVEQAVAARPLGAVCIEASGDDDPDDETTARFEQRHVWCIQLTPQDLDDHLHRHADAFARHRMSDLLASFRDDHDRPEYSEACSVAVNNAIRVAFPRRETAPSAVFVPTRSSRRPPAPDGGSAFHFTPSPSPSTAFGDLCRSLGSDGPPDALGRAPPVSADPVKVLFNSLVDACIDEPSLDDLRVSVCGFHAAPHPLLERVTQADRLNRRAAQADRLLPAGVYAGLPDATPSLDDVPGDDAAEPSWEGVADGSAEPEYFGGQKEFHGRPRLHSAGSRNIPRPPTLAEVIKEQRTCDEYKHLYAYLQDGPTYIARTLAADGSSSADALQKSMEAAAAGYRMIDGVLVYTRSRRDGADSSAPFRIVLPQTFRSWALFNYHDLSGHFGVTRTYGLIAGRYYWPRMAADVREHIKRCGICARCKLSRTRAGSFHLPGDGHAPWETLTIDLYSVGSSDDGYDHVLLFADNFTRAVIAVPTRGTPTSAQVWNYYLHYVARYRGYAKNIRTDRGSIFISELIKEACAASDVTLQTSTAEHHETAGLAERFNAVMHDFLLTQRSASADPRWTRYLVHFEIAFNATIASSTGFSPFYLNHGREFPLPHDVAYHGIESAPDSVSSYVASFLDRIHKAWEACRIASYNSKVKAKRTRDPRHDTDLKFEKGHAVMVIKGRRHNGRAVTKWDEPTHGPYRIAEVLPHDNYRLMDLPNRMLHDEFHVSRLTPYPLITNDGERVVGDGEYYVKRIMNRRLIGADPTDPNSYEYHIRWLGYTPKHDTWERFGNLGNAMDW